MGKNSSYRKIITKEYCHFIFGIFQQLGSSVTEALLQRKGVQAHGDSEVQEETPRKGQPIQFEFTVPR